MAKIIFFILFIINLIQSTDIISFQLQYNILNNKANDMEYILYDIGNTYVYSSIKIGEPEFSIKTNFSLTTPHFSMCSNLEPVNSKNLLNSYDIYESKTFKNISCLNQYYVLSTKDIAAKEKFILNVYNLENKKYKDKIINDLDFVHGGRNINQKKENYSEIYYIVVGLQIFTASRYTQEKQFNFIDLLKEKEIISNNNWFIFYEKINLTENKVYNLDDLINKKQILFVGGSPHEFRPGEFSKEQLFPVYSNYFLWISEFKSVYYYRNNTKFNTGMMKQEIYHNRARISFNDFFIFCPPLYFTMIKNDFFSTYMSRDICHYYADIENEYYYCDKSENFDINNLKTFPTLYFEHVEFNYTFEFSYKDLFAEKDNKYIFLISSTGYDIDEWFFGNIFLRKYQLVFNQEAKTISFYNPNIEISGEENKDKIIVIKKSFESKYIIIIICLSLVLVLGIGFIIGCYFYNKNKSKKKKRANELDDDYEYIEDKNININ